MMIWLKRMIHSLFKDSPDRDPAETEALRLEFKTRYHHFKLLLGANNRCLDNMARMEQTLKGDWVFGMSFIRTCCTAVSVNVLTMIRNLEILAPGQYPELSERFHQIQGELDHLLHRRADTREKRLVIPFDQITQDMADVVGGKMAKLGEMKNRLNVIVPEGFVITAAAYEVYIRANDLQEEIDRVTQASGADSLKELDVISKEIQQKIVNASLVPELEEAVMGEWKALEGRTGRPTHLAIRSSALCEDSLDSSFAGQYRSELNVDPENFSHVYKEVIASKYSVQAMTYRLNRGFRDEDISICVGCMEMVDALAGGVLYTRNPLNSADDSLFINAAWGLPKLVVDGSDSFDLIVVSRQEPLEIERCTAGMKHVRYQCSSGEGIEMMDVSEAEKAMISIDDDTALELARLSIRIETYFQCPQDIEWALTRDRKLCFLQCRPLQQIHQAEPDPGDTAVQKPDFQGGITASSGVAAGPVYIARRHADLLWFPEHAILVVEQALPRWAPLLNRASAIISERGGFAGHLANVAREFSVPAIMNLAGIVDSLTPGEMITLDADACAVFRGKNHEILKRKRPARTNPLKGSTVHALLEDACRLIVPLNLLDPDSGEFIPPMCRTFHDITRFVHEKSVHAMFHFGKEHDFPEHSSKQLYFSAPLNWWILNLDDGFHSEIMGKYVRLEDIASLPMLAFWQGFVAVPWDGPPPVDGKGLMSVMFRSTMNPSLVPGVRSKYADRNYFMISKNYCSLSSRLGYHFATMEALVSSRISEDYISFQFKGGAADFERRLNRIHFIREILEHYGFQVTVREDNLSARMEAREPEVLLSRLKILGYLSLHTRQIDMIMTNPQRVAYYRDKLGKDIDTLVNV
ncbi:MAG: PEP/pyruvate-binding domain-containing protein [Pseudomonadota bacterium]